MAGVLGSVHAAFSLYWAGGGEWLLATLGDRMLDTFAGLEWLLVPVGLVKLATAWLPAVADAQGWPAPVVSRTLSWVAAAVLVVWGGLNTVVGNLVLAGAINPDGGYDRSGMVGHAFLWDPLFLAWGVALASGLALTTAMPPPTRRTDG